MRKLKHRFWRAWQASGTCFVSENPAIACYKALTAHCRQALVATLNEEEQRLLCQYDALQEGLGGVKNTDAFANGFSFGVDAAMAALSDERRDK